MALILDQFNSILPLLIKTSADKGGEVISQATLRYGETYEYSSPNHPLLWWNFKYYAVRSAAPLIWEGFIRNNAVLSCDGRAMYIYHNWISQKSLEDFKKLYPENARMQAVSLAELIQNTPKRRYRGENATGLQGQVARSLLSPCGWARVGLLTDLVLAGIGAWGLYGKINSKSMLEVANIIEEHTAKIDEIFLTLTGGNATALQKATAVFDVLKLIYSAGLFEAIYKAIMNSLEWWDMILYGIIGIGELAGAFLTDGAELIAIVAVELALIGFIASDSVKWFQACKANE